jgi:hypothetical protein
MEKKEGGLKARKAWVDAWTDAPDSTPNATNTRGSTTTSTMTMGSTPDEPKQTVLMRRLALAVNTIQAYRSVGTS